MLERDSLERELEHLGLRFEPGPAFERETAEERAKREDKSAQLAAKHLVVFDHRLEVDKKVVPLEPQQLDPGFYGAKGSYTRATKLQACLDQVVTDARFKGMQIALVDLTRHLGELDKAKRPAPEYAGHRDRDQVGVGSVAKIAPMLASYQLWFDLRELAKAHGITKKDDLFARARADWADAQKPAGGTLVSLAKGIDLDGSVVLWAKGRGKAKKVPVVPAQFLTDTSVKPRKVSVVERYTDRWKVPKLEKMFAASGDPASTLELIDSSTRLTRAERLELDKRAHAAFAAGFAPLDGVPYLERLRLMIGLSTNKAAATCVRNVGHAYTASTLLKSGLFDPERGGGLWLRGDYGGDWKDPKTKTKKISYGWSDAEGGPSGGATSGSLASFMTLLVQERLVSASASLAMRAHLDPPQRLTRSPLQDGLEITAADWKDRRRTRSVSALSKIGLLQGGKRGLEFDCAFIERTQDGVKLRYVAIALNADGAEVMRDLAVKLDECIMQNNGLTP
jgi:hypothetical protein